MGHYNFTENKVYLIVFVLNVISLKSINVCVELLWLIQNVVHQRVIIH